MRNRNLLSIFIAVLLMLPLMLPANAMAQDEVDTVFYTVNLNYNSSMGWVTGSGSYAAGDTAVLTVIPACGHVFSAWSDGDTNNPRLVVVDQDTTFSCYPGHIHVEIESPTGQALRYTYNCTYNTATVAGYVDSCGGELEIPASVMIDSVTYAVTSIADTAFLRCTSLTSVILPGGLSSIGMNAFAHCYSLESINLPASVNTIIDYAFYGCVSLTEIYLPTALTSLSRGILDSCLSMTTVSLGDAVTTIAREVFSRCTSLTEITLPATVSSIGNWAFAHCDALQTIISMAVEPPTCSDSTFNYEVPTDVLIYVPCGSRTAYQNADHWDRFTNVQLLPSPIMGLNATVEDTASVTITWESDEPEQYVFYVDNVPVSDSAVEANGSYTFTGLEAGTVYSFGLQRLCGEGDSADIAYVEAATACNPFHIDATTPFFEDFASGQISPCWERDDYYHIYFDGGLFFKNNAHLATSSVLLPQFDAPVGSLMMAFKGKLTPCDAIIVGVYSTETDDIEWLDTLSIEGQNQASFTDYEYYFDNYAGSGNRIALRTLNTGSCPDVAGPWSVIDDITVSLTAACRMPDALAAHNLGDEDSAWFSWTSTSAQFEVVWDTVTADIADIEASAITVSANTFAITDGSLVRGGKYRFYVRTRCSDDLVSDWRSIEFACGQHLMPAEDNAVDTLTGCTFVLYDNGGIKAGFAPNRVTTFVLYPEAEGQAVSIASGWYMLQGTLESSATLDIFDGDSVTGTLLASINGNGVIASPIYGSQGPLTLRLTSRLYSVDGFELFTTCRQPSTCQQPNGVVVDSVTTHSFRASWEALDSVQYELSLFVGDSLVTAFMPDTNVYLFDSLASGTAYNVGLAAVCDSDSRSMTVVTPVTTVGIYTLQVAASDIAMGTTLGSGIYLEGTAVTIAAIPFYGYYFAQWSDGDLTNPRQVNVDSNMSLVAQMAVYEPVHDTTVLVETETVYDTVVNIDTVVTVDTLVLTDTLVVTDTLVTIDTLVVVDTLTLTDTLVVRDTIVNVDTLVVTEIDVVHDTIATVDTLLVTDTLVTFDTIMVYDTIFHTDTVYIHDTIYVGVDEVETLQAKVYINQGQIVVEGADGQTVRLYDALGRLLATRQDDYSALRFDVPVSGTYLLQVGPAPARRVVVLK